MRMPILAAALLTLGHPAFAETPQVVVTPVFSTTTTASGQPIVLPQANAQVIVSTYDIAPGARLPVHKHPSPRYAYVLSGTLRVTEQASGKTFDYQTGQFIVEVLNAWHFGENIGTDPVPPPGHRPGRGGPRQHRAADAVVGPRPTKPWLPPRLRAATSHRAIVSCTQSIPCCYQPPGNVAVR